MTVLRSVWKAVGAFLGAIAGTQVDWITNHVFQFDLSSDLDTAIAVILAALGAWLAPKNKQRATVSTEGSAQTS